MADAGTLWIVATPIGTLEDLGARARDLLADVGLLCAEDTRRAQKLLSALNLTWRGKLVSLHEHNESRQVGAVVEALLSGCDVALLSDAGTPVLSDPGFQVVRRARELGLPVASVPGPSAFTAALAASGQPPLPATLVGFLPPRRGRRQARLAELRAAPGSLVLFLSPHRLDAELKDLVAVLGAQRPATLLAEISKRYERAEMATLGDLAGGNEVVKPRGEYVLVVGPEARREAPQELPSRERVRVEFEKALAESGDRRQAHKIVAKRLAVSKREVYALLIDDEGT
jgi:16S rRNA (cytidine1402-2'-O)-methyltransferase